MRSALLYLLLAGAFLGGTALLVGLGEGLSPASPTSPAIGPLGEGSASVPTLLAQIGIVLAAAWVMGTAFRAVGQPRVVGEMAAGILLGPSFLGWLAPSFSAALFPIDSLEPLTLLSQVGLVLFMFLVGVELDPRLLHGRGRTALFTSHMSIFAPFILGVGLALYLFPRLAEGGVTFTSFALFMGTAMSVTAFPVLARILRERNLTHTGLGALAIACAAIDDVTAWSILAIVVAMVRSDAGAIPLWWTGIGVIGFVGILFLLVRPMLRGIESSYRAGGELRRGSFALVLLLLFASAWTTEWLGIHAVFGAFALGVTLPREGGLVREFTRRLEDVTVVLLLPLFFAVTGLRTSIGLVSGVEGWLLAGLILLVAVTGKFGGSALAARLTGIPWRESAALGVLMNTRGLMELVVLSIGLELGVISPTLFTMMVLMAITTTLMTGPLLTWIRPEGGREGEEGGRLRG